MTLTPKNFCARLPCLWSSDFKLPGLEHCGGDDPVSLSTQAQIEVLPLAEMYTPQ
jgi:hypothetical protein